MSPVLRYLRDTLSSRARSNRYRARSKLVEAIAPAGYCRLAAPESGAWLDDFWDPDGRFALVFAVRLILAPETRSGFLVRESDTVLLT